MGSDPLLLANKSIGDNEGDINGVPAHNNSIIKDLQGDLLRSYELHNPLARCIGFIFFLLINVTRFIVLPFYKDVEILSD
uniref:Uncharacterized protein n=1 Tax=Cucumis melo TaxID=3656 RepID=A0A9I9DWC0_CUCME